MPAAALTLQVGQCGAQLGACVLDRLAAETSDADAGYFFRESKRGGHLVARAVLVDSEPRCVGAARGGDCGGRAWTRAAALQGFDTDSSTRVERATRVVKERAEPLG